VVPAYGILPPGLPGYNTNLQGLDFNPNKAVQLLSESKYSGDIPRIRITVPGSGGSIGLDLEIIIDQWDKVLGVKVETTQVDWATFLQDLNDKKLQAFAGLGWAADYPDPQNFIDVLFHGSSTLNHTGYRNVQVDQMIEKARTESDFLIRSSLYKEAEQIIVNDSPWIPLWYSGESYVLIKPYVKGYRMTPLIVPKLRYVEIIN
jgi:oligopeptide transport system substrate-binding protein